MIHYDDTHNWECPEHVRAVFLKHAKSYMQESNWDELPDPNSRLFFCGLLSIIRQIDYKFMERVEDDDIHTFLLTAPQMVILLRFYKIVQIELGEEHDDFQTFLIQTQKVYKAVWEK